MQYKPFKDGISLSRLGMGIMRLPVHGSDADIDYKKAEAIIDAAMKAGSNYGEAFAPDEIRKQSICIDAGIDKAISELQSL